MTRPCSEKVSCPSWIRSPRSARPLATSSGISSKASSRNGELAEHEAESEERGRQRAGDDDLAPGEVVDVDRLARDEDRPVARADRGAVRKQGVVVLDERVRGERDRGHLEARGARPLIQRLDVREHLLEAESARVDEIRRQRPVHERVVGVGAVADTDVHEAATLPALPGR